MSGALDGGPAFPTEAEPFLDGPQGKAPASAWGMAGHPGMTLRDYFAAKAMAALIHRETDYTASQRDFAGYLAIEAYFIADKMIAARGEAPHA